MKEETRWKVIAGLGLVTLSLAFYTIHYWIFQDAHHVLIYLLGDIAFIPIEVFIVTIIIDQMLESRERQQRMEKLNLVIGTFFSTAGTPLLTMLARADPCVESVRTGLQVRESWNREDFRKVQELLGNYECGTEIDRVDLEALRKFLVQNEGFMLRLVENPMVFEHESFTESLLAVSHLAEELKSRDSLGTLPQPDRAHLAGDIRRTYARLLPEWLKYMEYLKDHYPYLFSLAMRKNPFDSSASVVIGTA